MRPLRRAMCLKERGAGGATNPSGSREPHGCSSWSAHEQTPRAVEEGFDPVAWRAVGSSLNEHARGGVYSGSYTREARVQDGGGGGEGGGGGGGLLGSCFLWRTQATADVGSILSGTCRHSAGGGGGGPRGWGRGGLHCTCRPVHTTACSYCEPCQARMRTRVRVSQRDIAHTRFADEKRGRANGGVPYFQGSPVHDFPGRHGP